MHEFAIIKKYFAAQMITRSDVLLGVGDDAAIVTSNNKTLAITTDTLVAGVHFPLETSADDIGYKALAVNLSDLAAMGATPAWVTLALTLPEANEEWLSQFCHGFFSLAQRYQVQLIGGDLTKGPLSITLQAIGFASAKKNLLRSQAQPDDLIYVTGTLGDAGLALQFLQKKIVVKPQYQQLILTRLNRPEPRVIVGDQLRDIAHAAIDISDGLAADLKHILTASRVGATIYVDQLPLSTALVSSLSSEQAINLALNAGDDYELCFTLPAKKRAAFEKKLALFDCPCRCIGVITKQQDLLLCYQHGKKYHGKIHGYQHF